MTCPKEAIPQQNMPLSIHDVVFPAHKKTHCVGPTQPEVHFRHYRERISFPRDRCPHTVIKGSLNITAFSSHHNTPVFWWHLLTWPPSLFYQRPQGNACSKRRWSTLSQASIQEPSHSYGTTTIAVAHASRCDHSTSLPTPLRSSIR